MVKIVRPIPKVPNTPVRRIIRPGNWRLKNEEPLGYDEFGSPYWNPQLSSRWSGKRMAERRDSSISDEVTPTTPKRSPRQDLKEQSKSAQDLKEDFEQGSPTQPKVPWTWGPWPTPGPGDPFFPESTHEFPDIPPDDPEPDKPRKEESKDEEEDDDWQAPPPPPRTCVNTLAESRLTGLPLCGSHAQVQIQTKKFQKHRKTRSAYHKGRNRYYPF